MAGRLSGSGSARSAAGDRGAGARQGGRRGATHALGLLQFRAQAAIFGLQHLDVRAHGRGKRAEVRQGVAMNIVRHGLSRGGLGLWRRVYTGRRLILGTFSNGFPEILPR